jgi:hypothetical protein
MRNGEKILSLIGEKNDHTIRPRHNPARAVELAER